MSNKATIRKKIMKQMKEIYYPNDKPYIDWMGYEIDEDNYPTYHHIEKREDLKKQGESIDPTLENGAYLGNLSHSALHFIEGIDKELYYSWNHFKYIIHRITFHFINN